MKVSVPVCGQLAVNAHLYHMNSAESTGIRCCIVSVHAKAVQCV